MKIALIVVGLLGLIAMLAMLIPVRVRATLKGRGQYGDTWVLAGGLEFLKLTVTVAAAHASDGLLQVHFWRWRLLMKQWSLERVIGPELSFDELMKKLEAGRKLLERRFDWDQLRRFVLGMRRYMRMTSLKGNLKYCTPDVAVTGVISGALYAIAGLLSPAGELAIVPEWEDVARAQGDISVVFRLWPGRAAAATAWFVMRNMRLREPAGEQAQAASQALPAQS